MPTYSGGLGLLAGDTLRAAADRALPMVGVTLLHRKGYFRQKRDASGWQTEEPDEWRVEKFLKELHARLSVVIEGRTVRLRAWQFDVRGVSDGIVPVYLLDTDLAENAEWDRHLTDQLYGGAVVSALPGNRARYRRRADAARARPRQTATLSHETKATPHCSRVAKRYGEISQHMFAQYKIDAITNGVHAPTWVSEPFQELI
jgi:glucan phosphorylase